MKSYMSASQFQIVGKAWQIRILLKQWQKQERADTLFSEFLQKRAVHK
ncbi:Z-ring formation inhibitor MciZ [Paenibacillus sediminis]|uniref:Z-ring formation inhibitor MciZ n=1 Tax=Paenibacillus sediminis TaxID=664909 RepID=A0ABS4GZQ2_9BACL|nr:Z-ring formation inhibitor MciZ [Paenibacillus sediminis]MBP1935691.1 hypothetical protein [Paenibacillus sediminis]